jgi:hypothetical protein
MLKRARAARLPARWVAADEIYGGRDLRTRIRELGYDYAVAVPASHRVTTPAGRFAATSLRARLPRTREALRLIEHGESLLAAGSQHSSPDWFTWFSPARLAAFKGNTQLKAGHLPQAKETLLAALNDPSIAGNRGRSVILGDLAAVEAAQHDPEAACTYAIQALDQLGRQWHATGMDRVLDVRKALQPDAELDCVQRLDDRL